MSAFAVHDWAVARDDNLQVLVGLPFDVNRFVKNLRLCPFSVHPVFVGCCGIERLDVEVLNVGAVIREAPGDAVVVTDDDERGAGQSEAFRVVIGRGEMNFVPDRRYREFEMRVVGEKRLCRWRCARR